MFTVIDHNLKIVAITMSQAAEDNSLGMLWYSKTLAEFSLAQYWF